MFQDFFEDDEIDGMLLELALRETSLPGTSVWRDKVFTVNAETLKKGLKLQTRLGDVEIVENTANVGSDYETDFFVVFQVRGDDRYFKKGGTHNSYGTPEWESGMEIAKAKTKTITVFE